MARDDVTETEVRARMSAQMDEALKRKRADYIIENNGSQDALRREVQFLLQRFLRIDARAVPDPQPDDVVVPRAAPETRSGGTVIAPAPTGPSPSRTPTQVPTDAPKPAPPGAMPPPSSLSTLPPTTSRPVPPKTPSPPPAPPPGVKVPTPIPSSAAPPIPTPDQRRTEPAIPIDAVKKMLADTNDASTADPDAATSPNVAADAERDTD